MNISKLTFFLIISGIFTVSGCGSNSSVAADSIINETVLVNCGNGTCEQGENCENCAADCGCKNGQSCQGGVCIGMSSCGNVICESDKGENCDTCPDDCVCKNGQTCQNGTCTTTDTDTGTDTNTDTGTDTNTDTDTDTGTDTGGPVCGNGTCETGENCENCAADCGCKNGQTCQNGTCITTGPVCGNGTCETGENCENCAADCGCKNGQTCQNGTCTTTGPACGNGTCETGENCENCVADCSCSSSQTCQNGTCITTGPVCGNGSCEQGENCENCAADCGCSSGQTCQNGTCVTTPDLTDCKGYADCAYGCNQDQACITNCQNQSTPAALSTYQDLQTCIDNNNCSGLSGSDFNKCVDDNCLGQYFKCFSGDTYQTCVDLFDCTTACPDDDLSTPDVDEAQVCVNNCWENSTYNAQWDRQHLSDCINDQCTSECDGNNANYTPANCNKCIDDNCQDQYFKCFSGDTYQTCVDLVDCLNGCPDDDPNTPDIDESKTCIGDCWENSTYDTEWDLQHLLDCANNQCTSECSNPDSDTCKSCFSDALYSSSCTSYANKCFTHGTATCGQIMDCMNGCTTGDQACMNDCYDNGSLAAQKQYSDWQQCGLDACPTECADPNSDACNTCWQAAVNSGGSCNYLVQACSNS